jgi:large subunit ribosomal protein L9
MKVVFLSDVKGTASAGDTKEVADGFARNFLLPRRLAVPATAAHLKELKQRVAASAARTNKELETARALGARIQAAAAVVLKVKAGETGKLYGSVTNTDVAAALEEKGIALDRRKIVFKEPVRALGEHQAEVRLHPQVVAQVTVRVESQ